MVEAKLILSDIFYTEAIRLILTAILFIIVPLNCLGIKLCPGNFLYSLNSFIRFIIFSLLWGMYYLYLCLHVLMPNGQLPF